MRRSIGAVAFVLFLCALAGTAGAIPDEQAPGQKGRREKALKALDKEVGKLVALVKNVDKMRTFDKTKFAPMKAKLKQLLDEVNSNSGNDSRAGAVISFWPGFVESFDARLGDLENLKKNHRSAKTTGDQCKATGTKMISGAKSALVTKSLDDMDNARYAATQLSTPVLGWISSMESMQGSMSQWERNTRLFEPTGNYDKAWKPVYKALHKSSKKMLDGWNVDWTTASKLCAEPRKGENHAEVKKLEDQLYETLATELKADLDKWRASVKTMYRYDCDSMKKLYDYYCTVRDGDGEVILDEFQADDGADEVGEDFPVDGDSEDIQYDMQADKMMVDMKQKEHAAWTELGALKSRADALGTRRNGRMGTAEAYVAWRDGWTKWVDEQIRPEEQEMERVNAAGIYQGSRNPKIQLWKNFGIQQHEALEKQDKFKCTLADASYCRYRYASGPRKGNCARYTRPDCVSVTQCKIWEFKPVHGKANGEKQVSRYKRLLEKHYNFAMKLFREDNLGSFQVVGDTDVLKALESTCLQGDKITFEKEVYSYPKCGADLEYQCSPKGK